VRRPRLIAGRDRRRSSGRDRRRPAATPPPRERPAPDPWTGIATFDLSTADTMSRLPPVLDRRRRMPMASIVN